MAWCWVSATACGMRYAVDHRPEVARADLGLSYLGGSPDVQCGWDHDALARCWNFGERRPQCMQIIEGLLFVVHENDLRENFDAYF